MSDASSTRARLEAILAKTKRTAPAVVPHAAPSTAPVPADETTTIAERDAKLREKIKSNPVFLILHDPSLTKEQVDARLAPFFDNDAQGDAVLEAAREYLDFVQMVRRTLAVDQIKATSDKIHSSYQQTMDGLYKDLGDFETTVAPLSEAFDLIQRYNKEEQTGEAEPLAIRISKAMTKNEEMKTLQADRESQAETLDSQASELERKDLVDAETEHTDFAGRTFVRSSTIERAALKVENIKTTITTKRAEAAELRCKPLVAEDDKDYDPNLLKILDVSGPEFQRQAHTAADTTINIINSSQEHLDEAITGLLEVQDRVAELYGYANDIDSKVQVLHEAVLQATLRNKVGPDAVPEASVAERAEVSLANSKKRRYLAGLGSLERNLTKTTTDVRTGITSIEVLDENIRQSIEQAAEVRTNTVATVSNAVSTFLQAIVFESNANKIDMIASVLTRLGDAAAAAQKGQIEMLPEWLRKDNMSMEKRARGISDVTKLLDGAKTELLQQRQRSVELGEAVGLAVDLLRETSTELRDVQINPPPPSAPASAAAETPVEPISGGRARPQFPEFGQR